MTAQTQVDALNAARKLIEAGVPVFLAPPIKTGKVGFKLPSGWEKTKPDVSVVDKWKPGWALCAVMGHVVDAIDIDPRNGGTLEALVESLGGDLPTVYGKASTPSGGEHYLIASIGVRKVQDLVPGVDLQAGNAEGAGRGFIFIAPTERESKADGEMRAYEWEIEPDLGMLLIDGDGSGEALQSTVTERHGAGLADLQVDYDGPAYDELDDEKKAESDEYVAGHLERWRKKFEEVLHWPEGEREEAGRMRGWEGLTYQFAWALAKMAACPWASFTEEGAGLAFDNILPPEMAEAVPGKWYEGISSQAAEEPVDTPPWVVRGDPNDDFSRTKTAWPPVPERFNDAYLCAWMAHRGLEGDWCWASGMGWLHWDSRRWERLPEEDVIEAVRKAFLKVASKAVSLGDSDLIKAVSGLLMRSRISAVTSLVKGVVSVKGGDFDQQNDLLNVGNGVVDLRTGDLLPWDRKYLMTKITETSYVAGARHPDWDTCLTCLDPEVMDWMQIRFGQGATGWPTSDDILPVGAGGGSNGKSTLLAGIFTALGEHVVMVPDKLLNVRAGDHPTEMMTVFGVRMAIIEETPEAGRLDVQRMKGLLGTSRIVARGIAKDNVSWMPTHSLFLMTNYIPYVPETDHGVWRRLALVRYLKTFPKKESFRANISSGADGRREAVLAWIVDGAVRWYEAGRSIPNAPPQVDTDTRRWRGESDMLLSFMDEGHFEIDPSSSVVASDFLDVLNKWLLTRGQKPWSSHVLATRMRGHEQLRSIGRKQVYDLKGVSQHPASLGNYPKRPWLLTGVRWTETDNTSSENVNDFL